MDSARKIELQSPEDLAYLVENVRRAATARIDEAFPPVDDNTEDELRSRIEELVDEVCFLSFCSSNITFSFHSLFSLLPVTTHVHTAHYGILVSIRVAGPCIPTYGLGIELTPPNSLLGEEVTYRYERGGREWNGTD